MTSSEVLLLQRELHKLAEQNREDHKLVRQALGKLQKDLDSLNKRLDLVVGYHFSVLPQFDGRYDSPCASNSHRSRDRVP